jgi:hypothetical protein
MLFLSEDTRFHYEFNEILHLSVTLKDICELLNKLFKSVGLFWTDMLVLKYLLHCRELQFFHLYA